MNSKRKIAIAASALAALTSIVLITNQANATDATPVPTPTATSQTVPPVTPSVSAPVTGTNETDGENLQSGDQNETDGIDANENATDGADANENATDGDNNPSGDQTGSDVAGATDAESSN